MFSQLCDVLPTCIANICIDYVSDERILKKQFHRPQHATKTYYKCRT